MLGETRQSTRFSLYAAVLVALGFVAWQVQVEQWFATAMVVVPVLFSGYALLFAKSKSQLISLLCLAVISIRVIDSLQYHYTLAASKMIHAEDTDTMCKSSRHYALTEADKGDDNACANAIKTLSKSRMQIALSSLGGLNAWIWLLTGLDFKAGFYTLAESHVGFLWAAGTCFAVVTLFSSVALAVYARIAGPAPVSGPCVPEHNSSLYTPPQITYPKQDLFFSSDLPSSFKKKKE